MQNLTVIQVSDLKDLLSEVIREELHKHLPPEKEDFHEYPELLTRKQVAHLLGVSIGTIDNWSESGRLKKIYIGAVVRYNKRDIISRLGDLKLFIRPID